MNEFALLIDGQFREIRRFKTQPENIPHKQVTWHPVIREAQPASTLTQDPVENWGLSNGAWAQSWSMVDVSPEEAARRQQREADRVAAAEVKADTFVQNFISMTPAQVSSYINNNTNNIEGVRALLNKMALMLLALARREYK